ncbi:MAG: hypothetical protein IT210_21460 [Armatimonadetes bacterium]|nr:hypothetical protein [Armatimonadota bacterium]
MKTFLLAIAATGLAGLAAMSGSPKVKPQGGYLVYRGGGAGPVAFSHTSHGSMGFRCNACHPFIPRKASAITMAAINEGKGCGLCHNGKKKAPANGKAAFPVGDCKSCHMPEKDLILKGKHMGDIPFSHLRHTGTVEEGKVKIRAGYTCGNCHPAICEPRGGVPIGMLVPHDDIGCAACHNGEKKGPQGRTIFTATGNCTRCHKSTADYSDRKPGQP